MSNAHYAFVLADLRAKYASMGELIAALENVSRLGTATIPPIEVPTVAATEAVGRLARTTFAEMTTPEQSSSPVAEPPPAPRRRTPPLPTVPPNRVIREGDVPPASRDDELVRLVVKHPGLKASGIARKFDPKEQNVDGLVARLLHHLKRLVANGRLVRHGRSYYPPGTPAPKEAP